MCVDQYYAVSARVACAVLNVSESCYRYEAKFAIEDTLVVDSLLRLAQTHKRWGFGLCFLYLRNVKGSGWKHKRVYRIYHKLELSLRIKPRLRIKRNQSEVLGTATAINQSWSMVFLSESP